MPDTNFQTNLRRLLFFHHRSGREAAKAIGTSERTVSQWLTGKRYPSSQALLTIDKLYGISPRELDSDPMDFAYRLADRDRIVAVFADGTKVRGSGPRKRKVVPIKEKRR